MQLLGGNSWKRQLGARAGDGDSWQGEQLEDIIFPGCIADGVLYCVLGTG